MTQAVPVEDTWKAMQQPLRRFIASRIGNVDEADDILHDVFLKLHNNSGKLRESDKVQSWLFRVTRNAITDHYRAKKRTVPADHETLPDEEPAEPDAHQRIAESLRAVVSQLPEPYREAIILTEFRGLTQRELAEHAGISLSGAKSRVQRAREKMKQILLECCHFEFDRTGRVIDYQPRCSCCSSC